MELAITHKPIVSLWRNILEVSPMINNDEHIRYSQTQWTQKMVHDVWKDKHSYMLEEYIFGGPKLVLSRPCYSIENINSEYKGPRDDEPIEQITAVLDEFYILNNEFKSVKGVMSPSKVLAFIIGNDYYDCMSGGMPLARIQLIKYVIEKYRHMLDMSVEVYPRDLKGNWYTLNDFMRAIVDIDIPNVIKAIDIK